MELRAPGRKALLFVIQTEVEESPAFRFASRVVFRKLEMSRLRST